MNTTKSREQQALAKLVRAFVSPSTPPKAMAEVVRSLKLAIRSPNDILRCETIPDQHFLKQEALTVRDAFEAATNGMSAPDAFQALEAIPADSVFSPWKDLVASVLAFYRGDIARLKESLARIPPDSFPGQAVPLWDGVIDRLEGGDPGVRSALPESDPFLSKLFPESDSLAVQAEELKEALAEGMLDLFNSGCGRFLREIGQRSQIAAAQAALLILRKIDAKGSSPDDFLSTLKACLGEAESLRLTALYLSDSRPSLALLFWIKSASWSLEESGDAETFAAWAFVLERAVARARYAESRGNGRAGEYRAALDPLVDRFAQFAGDVMPETDDLPAKNAYDRLARIADRCRSLRASSPPESAGPKKRPRNQLELFA